MVTQVIMPSLGLTMTHGTVVKWLKNEGDRVEKGDPLLEVLTDKANMEVEAEASGILRKILVQEGETVPVATVIALIADSEDEELPDLGAPPETSAPVSEAEDIVFEKQEDSFIGLAEDSNEKASESSSSRVKASPLARKMARDLGIDLNQLKGTGPGGRIVKADVLVASTRKSPEPQMVRPPLADRTVLVNNMRKLIAERMKQSLQEAPHFYLAMEVDMTEAINLRQSLNHIMKEQNGKSITFTDIIVKAAAHALRKYPEVNSSFSGDQITQWGHVNVGVAVAVEDGLVVPVVKDADQKTLSAISLEVGNLINKARENRLALSDLEEGTFTVSNLGMYGVTLFTAIINPPQSAILAVGQIADRPVVVNGELKVKPIMNMTLSADHRVIDGALAAQFLKYIKEILENPYILIY